MSKPSNATARPTSPGICPANHVHYLAVLCELVRVDLEYSWIRGTPKGLDHYRSRFPELFDDARCIALITFERGGGGSAQGSAGVPSPQG